MSNLKCAFHPRETIVNFCKSDNCFLPMCPLCIKIHSEEHKVDRTHGDFQSLAEVVSEIQGNVRAMQNLLATLTSNFYQNQQLKKENELELRKKINDGRKKCMQQIDRYFDEIENALVRSVKNYIENTAEAYSKIDQQMADMQDKLQTALQSLSGTQPLKTIILYFANKKSWEWKNQADKIERQVKELEARRVAVVIDNDIIIEIMQKLDQYLTLQYQNYVQTGFTAKQYSKARSVVTSRVQT